MNCFVFLLKDKEFFQCFPLLGIAAPLRMSAKRV
jgi:hypothetical protein